MQKDKDIFKFDEIPMEEFADSLGLPAVPHVKFVPGSKLKEAKNASHQVVDSDETSKKPGTAKSRHERMVERRNQTVLSKHYQELHSGGNTAFKVDDLSEEEDDIFSKKRKVDWDSTEIDAGNKLLVIFLLYADI